MLYQYVARMADRKFRQYVFNSKELYCFIVVLLFLRL